MRPPCSIASPLEIKPDESKALSVAMLSRPQLAHRFALRHAHEMVDREEQQTGDFSDGCGEDPGGSDETDMD